MIRLERGVGGQESVLKLKERQWAYWTWSPVEGEKYEYVVAPTPRGAIIGSRPSRAHPFYSFRHQGNL